MRRCALTLLLVVIIDPPASAQEMPSWLRDRGTGIPTSMFATYVNPGQLIVYPFLEYYRDKNKEYKPSEFGFGLDQDFRGRYRASEKLLFFGYGISDRLAAEFEISIITATLDKSPQDPSTMPARITESGLGDVEGQLRYRWTKESATRPEIFSYGEMVVPHSKSKVLIGTPSVEFAAGAGIIKGFSFGTVTLQGGLEKSEGAATPLYAIEYLKRLSDRLRLYTGIEGNEDEVEWIGELQIRLTQRMTLKLNNAFGVTSKATDWAPEIGIVFSF